MTENNQFLDPPIAPQYRTDEPQQAKDSRIDDSDSTNGDDQNQNEGYRSICRE